MLFALQAENRSVQSTGLAIANAQAQAEAAEISVKAEVEQATYQSTAKQVEEECDLELMK